MNEQELLLDCVRGLNRGQVAYMLTGSMASNAWGIPRTTHDLDFVSSLMLLRTGAIGEELRGEDWAAVPRWLCLQWGYARQYSFRRRYHPSPKDAVATG